MNSNTEPSEESIYQAEMAEMTTQMRGPAISSTLFGGSSWGGDNGAGGGSQVQVSRVCVEFWSNTYGYRGTAGTFGYRGANAPRSITAIYGYFERLTFRDDNEWEGMVVVSWDGE